MTSLFYEMIATQFTEQQWNNTILPAIQATLNAAGVVRNLAHAVLYGPEKYQGLAVMNPFFLRQIVHITAFMLDTACNSSTGKLLRYSAETFRVKIGISFSLIATPYDVFFILLPSLLVQIYVAIYVKRSVQTRYM